MDAAIGTITTPPSAVRRPAESAGLRVEAASGAASSGDRPAAPQDAGSKREINQDDLTGSLIFRLVDVSTGAVRQQTPSEAQLKLRAYIDNVTRDVFQPSFDAIA